MGRTADSLVHAVMMDMWPATPSIVDYGLVSQAHYEALYYPIRAGEVTADQLHEAAMQGGKALTALAVSLPSNPHKDVVFSPGARRYRVVVWCIGGGHSGCGPHL